MPDISDALVETSEGVILSIEVTAGAKRERFPAGFNPWRKTIGCRVAAPALEGRANAAVLSIIARSLGVPASSVTILSGATSSAKKVLVKGARKAGIMLRLSAGTD
jgi:uncharacterized protein (TIGR00251 family)